MFVYTPKSRFLPLFKLDLIQSRINVDFGGWMKRWLAISMLAWSLASLLEGGYTLSNGRLVNSAEVPRFSAEQHYALAMEAMNGCNWKEAEYHFNIIAKNFPKEPFFHDSQYYLGVSHYYLAEYDFANEAFSTYLNSLSNPRFFEDAIGFKLQIANCFHSGAKRRFFGTKALPKWAPARALATEIYTEVITALPCHDYAAQGLWGKAHLHWEDQDFRDCVEAFQQLIRRFPKHELAPSAYLCINQAYLEQAQSEFQNPDILALAQINLKRFERDFPKEMRLEEAAAMVQSIKEFYARGLFETGQFYERLDKPAASAIYYQSAIAQFPDTCYAKCCRRRLDIITRGTPTSEPTEGDMELET